MTSPTTLISIIIPCYNQAAYLTDCLKSVISQSYPHFEALLVNDGSTDETANIGNLWKKNDPRFHTIHQENQGLPAARNRGIEKARGKFIALLDSDDLMKPERLEKQLALMQENTQIDLVYSSVELIDEKRNPLGILKREAIPPQNFLAEEFFRHLIPTPSTLMGKASCFHNMPFDERFRTGEDYEWTLRAAHRFCFTAISDPLTLYRRHTTNISENLKKLKEAEWDILRSYGPTHILNEIEKSGYNSEDKELLKGKILYIIGEYADAIEHLLPLNNPLALFYLGNCYFEEQKLDNSQKTYEEALPSTNPALFNNLGVCQAALENFEQAKKNFEQALKLKEGYLDPKKNLTSIKENRKPDAFTRRELREDLMPYQKI